MLRYNTPWTGKNEDFDARFLNIEGDLKVINDEQIEIWRQIDTSRTEIYEGSIRHKEIIGVA
jgi:predicted nucleotidyltransferase